MPTFRAARFLRGSAWATFKVHHPGPWVGWVWRSPAVVWVCAAEFCSSVASTHVHECWPVLCVVAGWGGPLAASFIDAQYQLQLQILNASRSFGMMVRGHAWHVHVWAWVSGGLIVPKPTAAWGCLRREFFLDSPATYPLPSSVCSPMPT